MVVVTIEEFELEVLMVKLRTEIVELEVSNDYDVEKRLKHFCDLQL